ncbi:glycosyltransferase family 2 protein [Kitasatospora mediocidica]|uniref:glycosyltransferase family 2 protein n=1 Tax=Kitasatospora mediocidica TaxID=58352 RepID=UPI00068A5DEE|nr:glycosyltransferase family 2 protein [Kitasatospora mediocidica]
MTTIPRTAVLPSLSVVICAYTTERWEDLSAAVASVRSQRHPADEILLVIDHCPELAARARAELDGLRVIPNRQRQGLSGARNTGVEEAGCEVVAFLDDDAAADPDWTARLLAGYLDPRVLGVGGLVRPWWETGRPAWFPREFDWVVGCSYRGLPEQSAQIRNFIGANMSFRRAEMVGAGGFRTDLGRVGTRPLGCEETELCLRMAARNPGSVLRYEPSAAVRHHVPPARTTWSYFRARCYAEGLSKAAVARYAGSGPALASERGYLRSTIPSALVRGLRPGGGGTVPALVTGVAATVLGYLRGRLTGRGSLPARLGLPVALLLWLLSLRGVNLSAMGDLGLVRVLPVTFWAALAVLVLGFGACLTDRRTPTRRYAGYLVGLITMLHATPALLYPELRYSWAWKHVAVTDALMQHGTLPNGTGPLQVYRQWPGFFVLNELILRATGLNSALSYAAWAPLLTNLALLAPLVLLYRSFTRSRRLVWGGAFLFFACSWVGQDYYSPQAFAFVLYVCVVAVVVRRLPRAQASAGRSVVGAGRIRGAAGGPRTRWVLLLMIPVAAMVCAHPLTPLMLVGTLVALAIPRRNRRVVLPVLLGATLLTAGWDLTVARPYLSQNLHAVLIGLTQPGSNATSGVLGLAGASPGQVMVAWTDRGLTALVFVFAAVALLRRRSLRHTAVPLLVLAPLPWLLANSYGGEMVFRVYLFALPAAAFAAVTVLLVPRRTPASRRAARRPTVRARRVLVLPAALLALLAAFSLAYYGKEEVNYFTPSETTAAQWLYSHAPTGSLVMGANDNFPYAYTDYGSYDRLWMDQQALPDRQLLAANPIAGLETMASGHGGDTFLILTRSQQAELTATGALPGTNLSRLESTLATDPHFPVLERTADAVVYQVLPEGGSR